MDSPAQEGQGLQGPTGAAERGETTQRVSTNSSSQTPSGQEAHCQQSKEKELLLRFKILQHSFTAFE